MGEEGKSVEDKPKKTSEEQQLTTPQLLHKLLDASLYAAVEIPWSTSNEQIRKARLSELKFDKFCPGCRQSATWTMVVDAELKTRDERERATVMPISSRGGGVFRHPRWTEDFRLDARCTRYGHSATYYFAYTPSNPRGALAAVQAGETPGPVGFTKIGQWPSLTDFQIGDLSRFEEGMTRAQRKEFVRGINTSAHGFSVAACVYYRRVFESVIADARTEFMKANSLEAWPEFDAAKTDDRIRMLRGHLPEFMAEHPELYSILSKGVHELTEEECARELPMLRQAIELIMEDRVTEQRRRKQREAASKLVAQRHNDLRNGSGKP